MQPLRWLEQMRTRFDSARDDARARPLCGGGYA